MAPSHYLNQCWNVVNWTIRNKLQWNLKRNSYIFIQENAFENVVWKMAAILSRPQCVKLKHGPVSLTYFILSRSRWIHLHIYNIFIVFFALQGASLTISRRLTTAITFLFLSSWVPSTSFSFSLISLPIRFIFSFISVALLSIPSFIFFIFVFLAIILLLFVWFSGFFYICMFCRPLWCL